MTAYITEAASRQVKVKVNLARNELGIRTYNGIQKHKN